MKQQILSAQETDIFLLRSMQIRQIYIYMLCIIFASAISRDSSPPLPYMGIRQERGEEKGKRRSHHALGTCFPQFRMEAVSLPPAVPLPCAAN